MTTGIDIVTESLRAASGEELSCSQEAVAQRGHAIECRINAEASDTQLPSPGAVTSFLPPRGFGSRFDTHLQAGYTIPIYHDWLIAKVVACDRDRVDALGRMRTALTETVIEGVKTNIPHHHRVLDDPRFRAGDTHTKFLEELGVVGGTAA